MTAQLEFDKQYTWAVCQKCGGTGKVPCECVFDSIPHSQDKCPGCNGTGLAHPELSRECQCYCHAVKVAIEGHLLGCERSCRGRVALEPTLELLMKVAEKVGFYFIGFWFSTDFCDVKLMDTKDIEVRGQGTNPLDALMDALLSEEVKAC